MNSECCVKGVTGVEVRRRVAIGVVGGEVGDDELCRVDGDGNGC